LRAPPSLPIARSRRTSSDQRSDCCSKSYSTPESLLGLHAAKDTCRVGLSRCPPDSETVERSPLQFPVQEGRITAAKAPPRRRSATRAKCRKRAKAPSALRRRRIPVLVNQSFGPSFSGAFGNEPDPSLLIISTQKGRAPPPCRVR
jgi:hypothetical protein